MSESGNWGSLNRYNAVFIMFMPELLNIAINQFHVNNDNNCIIIHMYTFACCATLSVKHVI